MLDRLRGHADRTAGGGRHRRRRRSRLEEELGNRLDTSYRKLQKALLSERYFRLLDDLEAFSRK